MGQKLRYFPQLDVLRAVAILAVIINHWLHQIPAITFLTLGRLGVDLFFVISGFLITRILFYQRQRKDLGGNLRTFYIRRVLRIFPAYYLVVILSFLFNEGVIREALPWNLTYTSNFFMLTIESWAGSMTHFWSLAVEEQFYLCWPLLILVVHRKYLLHVIVGSIILGVLSRAYFWGMGYNYLYVLIFPSSCLDVLGTGALLAYLYEFTPLENFKKWVQRGDLLILSFLLLISLYYPFTALEPIFFRLAESLFYFFVVGRAILGTKGPKSIIFVGKLSYSMYLFHNFIPGIFLGMAWPGNVYLRFLIEFAALLIISYLSYRWVESPINRLKKNFPY